MKLITELVEDGFDMIVERKEDGTKEHKISGIFMQSNVKNRNGRIYPRHILEGQVNAYQDRIKSKRALSELNHPNGPSINLDRVSHLITKLSFDGDNVLGEAKVLATPCGQIVKALIEDGVNFGVSSRGLGTVKANSQGINEVQKDFHLAAIDVVADPSGPECWVDGIMESAEWTYDERGGWKMIQAAEQAKQDINEAARSGNLGERSLVLFERYLNRISKITQR